ncbi:MAG: imidazole glycerol phosphate synthase subunit HisH [Candidatus Margulisiibacteriota bacterium]|jgi:glutamine amidotransferase
MINIIDYKAGNLKNVLKAFEFLGYKANITNNLDDLKKSSLLVLPGVGAFELGITNLKNLHLISFLKDYINSEKPFLGICLGFQLLFESSHENGFHQGLGIFEGTVKKFETTNLKVPHMGWNTVKIKKDEANLYSTKDNAYYYFVHSYYVATSDRNIIATTTNYGPDFVSSIEKKNLLATQFHPEKSGEQGLTLLKNFILTCGL